jgi:hypothetical protein
MKLLGVIDNARHQFILNDVKYEFCIKCGWDKKTIKRIKISGCSHAIKRDSLSVFKNYRHNLIYYKNSICACGYISNFYNCTKCLCVYSPCKACSIFDGSHLAWEKGKTFKEDIPIIIKRGTDIEMPCRLSDDDVYVADIIL